MRHVSGPQSVPGSAGEPLPLAATRVSVAYDARRGAAADFTLHGVDLEVRRGELVAVLGANGAGKTTLLRVLSGTLRAHDGEVRLFGERLDTLDRRDVARKLAVVAQDETPAFGWTVREVVTMGRAPHQGAWLRPTADDEAIVGASLARCDLEHVASRPVAALSGGERKRVTIARALAQKTPVLLLDEPSAFLDVRHQVALYDLLASEVESAALACVVVVHDLNVAARYAHRVALMKAGRLLAIGAVEAVMTPEHLADAFEVPLETGRLPSGRRYFLPA